MGLCGHSTDYSSYSTIDNVGRDGMKKVYCKCGCIIDLDSSYLIRRLKLGKDLECVNCRNARISKEIDELNNIYSPDAQDDDLD